jgi:fibronectin type 3 domain-containing protein/DNA-binding beta-propeller fold protein YncE
MIFDHLRTWLRSQALLRLAATLGTILVFSACGGGGGGGGGNDQTPPAAPTGLEAQQADGTVSLSWRAAERAASYRVLRSETSGGPYSSIASPTATSHTDDVGLTNGKTYYYVVRAVNEAGESPSSNEVSATPQLATQVPTAPTGLTATPGNAQVALSWTASAGATSYEVQRDMGCAGTFTSLATPTATTYTDTGLTNGTPYCYVVKAKNAAGTSAASSQARATPTVVPSAPPAPTGLTGTPGDARAVLSWTASAGATSYEVQRDMGCTGTFTSLATPTATTHTDTGLTNGTPYCYVVKAKNAAGTSAASSQVRVTPEAASSSAPSAPTNVTATPGNAQVVLTWSASSGATGYTVQRGTAPGGPYVQAGTPSTTTFTDSGLVNGRPYYYVVRATNTGGTSLPSAEVSATPLSSTEICVTNENTHTVVVFDPSSSGNVQPLRRLGNLTGMNDLNAVAVDRVNGEIYVANSALTPYTPAYPVTVYARTASGNMAPVRYISGPATGLTYATGLAVDPVNNELFVSAGGVIRAFPRTANGNVAPLRSLTVCSACEPGIAVDPAHGELFAPSPSGNSISVYPRTAQGTTTPLRRISGSNTNLSGPTSVSYDAVHDELISTSSNGAIGVFPRLASGNAFPTRTIFADFPAGLTEIAYAAVDDASGDIYVASTTSVAVFARSADQGAMPSRTISGANVGFTRPFGIAVDPANGEVFISDGSARRLVVHSLTANGNVAPLRTLSGSASGVDYPNAIAAAPGAGKLFVSNPEARSVTAYATPWTGTPTPVTTLSGTAAQINSASAIAIDELNGEMFVTNWSSNTVSVHALGATGNTAPLRTLAGTLTGISAPYGVAVDPVNNELFVTNDNARTITVYGRTASGNVAPLRKLGPTTGLGYPSDIAVDATNNEIVVLSWNGTASEVVVFSRTASGTAAVLRKISGTSTQLSEDSGVVVDVARNEILVTNKASSTITVYSRTASGNVAPLRTISGAATWLSRPTGITMCK